MLRETNISNPTGVLYLQDNPAIFAFVNVHNPTFSSERTGEDIGLLSSEPPIIYAGLLPYYLLSMKTGYELPDIEIITTIEDIPEYTDSILTIQREPQARLTSPTAVLSATSSIHTVSSQAKRVQEISGLTKEQLAQIFGVWRQTYYKWIAGSPLYHTHRKHLLEVLALMEEATQRLGSPNSVNTWLLTPVSPGGKKPIDYLADQQYTLFRGFLLRVRTGQEMFHPLVRSHRSYQERSPEEVEAALRRLKPRLWKDDEDLGLSDTESGETNP